MQEAREPAAADYSAAKDPLPVSRSGIPAFRSGSRFPSVATRVARGHLAPRYLRVIHIGLTQTISPSTCSPRT